jgi:hypothetical protein
MPTNNSIKQLLHTPIPLFNTNFSTARIIQCWKEEQLSMMNWKWSRSDPDLFNILSQHLPWGTEERHKKNMCSIYRTSVKLCGQSIKCHILKSTENNKHFNTFIAWYGFWQMKNNI